ncbi:MAG: MMPL family transporter [Bacilli bacterium]|nr:MMPL family transporter [Bacilli bacterium]
MIKTKINYNILVYLPEDIETMKGQEILTNDFNMGAFSISILDNMTPKEIIDYENKVSMVDGVEKVLTINDIIGTTIPIEILPTELRNKVYKDNSTLLAITFKNSTSNEQTLNAVEEIRKISDKAKIGGMSAMVLDTMNLSDKEVSIYVIIAVILCIIVLMLCLDSYVVPFILLINIGIAILYNMGTNIFLGDISYITKAISAVLQLGVTTDFSIFLYHRYEQEKKKTSKDKAMAIAIKDTFVSVAGSSLTTIAGFLALCTMTLLLGKDIGIVMAKGVLLGVICVLTIFPALLLLFDKIIDKTSHKEILPEFNHIKNFTIKHYKLILIIFLILCIPAYIGNKNVASYYNLSKSLPEDLPFNVANNAVEKKFDIASQSVILLDKSIKNNTINEMIDKINEIDGVVLTLSYSKISDLGIPESMLPSDLIKMLKSDKYQMIMINSKYETATDELNNQIDQINTIVDKYDKDAIVAGEGPLMKDLIKISDTDFHNVNYTSIAVIFIIMLFVLKSLSLPIILVIAIEFAIFVNMSTFYYTGVTLPFIASIVIGTIQLGATIDYAILMTTKYLEKRKTSDKFEAMKYSLDNSVKSIFTSGLCFFAATFGVGIYSKIDMIGAICNLIARGAIISMIVVIFILPALLLVLDNLIIKTTKGFKKGNEKNMKIKKINLAMLSVALLLPLTVSAATKNETVYSIINNEGNVSTTVTDILEGINGDVLDESDLENILNINSEEKYFKNDNLLTWKSNGNNIFYQGTTTKKLPIDIRITYYLNDEEINIRNLNNKSGHIKIQIDYKNNDKHGDLYTPFLVTTGMILKDDVTNAKINNGKIIQTGSQNIIIGFAAPNISDSLQIKDLEKFNSITIEYDTTSFKSFDIYNVYSPNLFSSDSLSSLDKLDELYSKMNTLSDSSTKLVDGSRELADKIKVLNEGTNKLSNELNNKINEYENLKIKFSDKEKVENQITDAINKELKNLMPELKQLAQDEAKTVIKNNLKGENGLESKTVETIINYSNEAINEKIKNLQNKDIKLSDDIINAVSKNLQIVLKNITEKEDVKQLENNIKQLIIRDLKKSVKETTTGAINAKINSMKNQIKDPSKLISGSDAQNLSAAKTQMAQAMIPGIKAQFAQKGIEISNEVAYSKALESVNNLVSTISKKTMDTTLDQVGALSNDISDETIDSIILNFNTSESLKTALTNYTSSIINEIKLTLGEETIKALEKNIAKEITDELINTFKNDELLQKEVYSKIQNEINITIENVALKSAKKLANDFTEDLANQIASNLINKQFNGELSETKLNMVLSKYENKINTKLSEVDNELKVLKNALSQLTDGTNKLQDGSSLLAGGVKKFDDEGIKKLVEYVNGDVKTLESRIKNLAKLGENYQTFTMKNSKMNGETKFIVKIEAN